MFANTQMGGVNIAFPDVCNTPTPAGPVPIPYPNIDQGMTANPATASLKVFYNGAPAHHLNTVGTISSGDNAGVNLGVASGTVMGPRRHVIGSFSLLVQGMPATKMTGMTGQNGMSMNVPGATVVPSQYKILLLK